MRKVLRAALEFHRSGQPDEAAALYQSILTSEPENTEALHWFGVLHQQAGDPASAVRLIGRAVELKPDSYLYHGNLAEAYRAVGDHERAVESCRSALRLWPDYAEALCCLGTTLTEMKRLAEAVESLRRAVAARPTYVVAINNLGIALRELGQGTDALAQFRRAVELEPGFAPARTNLGQALLNQNEPDEALVHSQEAVRLDPSSAEMHDNLGNVLRALERLDDAWGEHWAALQLAPDLAPANAHIGLILQRRGHLDEALTWLKKAVALKPDDLAIWQWLAALYDERDEPNESIPCWRRVLELEPQRVSAQLALGRALQDEGRLDEARACYQTALDLEPDLPAAHLDMGGLHELLGAMDQAEASYRTAIRNQPGLPIPHARLATLLRGKLSASDLIALEDRLAEPSLGEAPRTRLLFATAHVLDARGDYARAADCLAQANAIAQRLSKERLDYQPLQHEQFIDGLLRAFNPGLFSRLAGVGLETARPVFVFGLPRSGTTLIEQVLASHSRVHGAGELRLARRSFDAVPGALGRTDSPVDCVGALDAVSVHSIASLHLDRLAEIDSGRSLRIIDKMPDNYLYLGLLAILFPKATYIHCRRDLRDVAVSCWMTDFSTIRWANDVGHIASRFRQYRRVMDHWSTVLPLPIHQVDYEETVHNLEGVARRLVSACGLEWEPACLEFHRTERPVKTASVTQVRQPVYQRSVARWKNYEPALTELFAALADPEATEGR